MRRLLFLLIVFLPFVSFGQSVITQGNDHTMIQNKGGFQADSVLFIPHRNDNAWYGRYGDLRINTNTGNLEFRKGGQWVEVSSSSNIPTVNNATLTLTTTVYGATNTQTWTSNSATNKNWAVNVAGTDITTGLNVHTGVLTMQSSTGNDDSVQLLSKINDKGYLQPTTGTGVNTGGGFAATAQTEAFNSTYIDLSDGTYTLYIVAGGNPSGGDIKLVDPNEIPDRIIRIVNTSGATGTFINAPIVGLTSSSVTTINSGKYIVIQSVTNPSTGDRMWAQVGGNY